jgi:hypothetical protein
MEQCHSQVCELRIVHSTHLWVLQADLPVEVGFYMIPTRMAMLVLKISGDQAVLRSLVLEPFAVFPRAESAISVQGPAEAGPLLVVFLVGLGAVLVWPR